MVPGAGWPQQSAVHVGSGPVVRGSSRRGVRAIRDYFLQVVSVAGFHIAAVTVNAAAALLCLTGFRRDDPAYWQGMIGGLFRGWLWIMGKWGVIEVDFPDADRIAGARGLIVAANHPGLIDAAVLLACVPRGVCIMRSSDLRRNPTLSALSRLAGYIPNDTGAGLVRGGLERLARGENLVIFPEGTRTRGARPGPFKRGFAIVAAKSGATIQTVLIKLEGPMFRKGVSLLRPVPLPVRLEVRTGSEMKAAPGESARELVQRVEDYFAREAPDHNALR